MNTKYLIFLTLVFSVYSCTVISEKAAQKADKESSSQFFKDLGHDLTDAEKADLEIPAFLRRQTN